MAEKGQGTAVEPAPLRIWCADPVAAAPLAALLGAERLETLPETPGEAPLLILHLAPAAALARAMSGEQGPEAAVAAWRAETVALLRLHRAARRQVRLAELLAARANPAVFAALFGLPAPENPFAEPESAHDPILCLLAQRLILGTPELAALAAELEAASADLTGGAGLVADDPEAAWRARADLAGGGAVAARARQEAELLKAQNRAMMEELENLARQRQAVEARLAQTSQGLESYQAQAAALESAMAGLRQRMAHKEASLQAAGAMVQELEVQAARLKDDLAGAQDRAGTLEDELAAERAQAAALRGEIDRIMGSRSFRLTAPLRRMRALLGGRP